MKKILIIFSITLNFILAATLIKYDFSYSNRHLGYCQQELEETLYLLDLANSLLKSPSNKLDKNNPYLFELNSDKERKFYYFKQNPEINVISHSASYDFELEVDSNNLIKRVGWFKP